MSDKFQLVSTAIDLESLAVEIERRAGPGPDEPPGRPQERIEQLAERAENEPATSVIATLLRSLAEDADVAQGFPAQSHRVLGGAVVAAKKGFRLALQPLINDAFARQKVFNRRLLDTIAALHAENQILEARVKTLEANAGRQLDDG